MSKMADEDKPQDQKVAIAMSMARKKGLKVPKEKKLNEGFSEKGIATLQKWIEELGTRSAAVKLIDTILNKIVGLSSSDLADTSAFSNGLDEIEEAFNDRNNKGFAWNNMMLQRWVDHNGLEHRVLEDYERNRKLIDLAAQPQDIRDVITETINTNAVPKTIDQVGIRLLKFCNLYDLKKITDSIQQYAEPFQAKYQRA